MKIGIINYGSGNITSIQNALEHKNKINSELVSDPDILQKYDKLILPGVGAFHPAMQQIKNKSLDIALLEYIKSGKYLLGICLGMQLLSTKSYEHGELNGLNLIEGEVKAFDDLNANIRTPHMGWNSIDFKENKLLNGIDNLSDLYFIHSYYYQTKNIQHTISTTSYGTDFSSIIQKDNIFGVQFHPEKSQENGLKILKNFLEL